MAKGKHAAALFEVIQKDKRYDRSRTGITSIPRNTDPAALFSSNCASCHTFQPANATGTVGPDLDNLAADATKYGGGQSPEEYVKESIVDPDKVVVSGFPKGVMPSTFGSSLTPDQIDALVQYLLKGGS